MFIHPSFFCEIPVWYKKNNNNNEKTENLIKRIISALCLLQKVKFEEIRKSCSYIIIYGLLYIITYNQFYLFFFLIWKICKKNKKLFS